MIQISKRLLVVAAIGSLFSPSMASAVISSTDPTRTPEVRASTAPIQAARVSNTTVCSIFTTLESKVNAETLKRHDGLKLSYTQRTAKLTQEAVAANKKLSDSRAEYDAKRAAEFVTLESKAKNETQKQAIVAFQATVKKAVAERRAAVDAANVAYHNAVKTAVNQRQNSLIAPAAAYKAAVASAFTTAKASCAAGTSSILVNARLKTSLEAARNTLKAAGARASRTQPNLDTQKATRKAAVEAANAKFKVAMSSALDILKLALKAGTASPSASAIPTPSVSPQ